MPDLFVPADPKKLQSVKWVHALGAQWTGSVPTMIMFGANRREGAWISLPALGTTPLNDSPEYWLDMSLQLKEKGAGNAWFSGCHFLILRALRDVNPLDWQVIHGGITCGTLPVSLPRPAYFPFGPAVVVLFHEAAGYNGAATNEIHVGGCYYAL